MITICKPSSFPPEFAGKTLRLASKPSLYTLLLLSTVFFLYTLLPNKTSPLSRPLITAVNPPPPPPPPPPTNLSHIIFAIGGSANTWSRRREYCDLWWNPDKMRGHVWLDAAPTQWPDTCPPWRLSTAAEKPAARIARIAADEYRMGTDGVRWFVMGDDDTLFFPENVAAVLGKYDHEQMYYVGAASESVEQNEMHSYGMGFGGGGFAVSYPAAAALAGAIDGCLRRYESLYGSDQRVHACFVEIGVPLTREPGFHQIDLRGDIYGMLAAHPIAPLLSLHHLSSVPPISPRFRSRLHALRSLINATRADESRALQQSFCYLQEPQIKWSVSVSWGYTAQIYPWLLSPREMEIPIRTFGSWKMLERRRFTFNTRELAPASRPCERPVRYFLEKVEEGREGTVTEYGRYGWGDEGRERCERLGFGVKGMVDKVRVTARRMDPMAWRKAPRRQCCEAKREKHKVIEVHIRDCRPYEITSPI
ncbi:uncharacterized protein LOC110018186 [Phalaenopsis equestris]|uniref:uncharacterized protein LOC110018186 n=1 Tax=Phalaenopsis equestris TaxID=78828 RepID=UPI0009E580EA|nr:uncharacterized protein LOC110018186 [Phalaenopsis equestris]